MKTKKEFNLSKDIVGIGIFASIPINCVKEFIRRLKEWFKHDEGIWRGKDIKRQIDIFAGERLK